MQYTRTLHVLRSINLVMVVGWFKPSFLHNRRCVCMGCDVCSPDARFVPFVRLGWVCGGVLWMASRAPLFLAQRVSSCCLTACAMVLCTIEVEREPSVFRGLCSRPSLARWFASPLQLVGPL
ncbi:unnamed protein product [Ectocarpus sp. 12 AP-2014]